MKLTSSFEISSSALTAQRLRMDVISANIANADTTRGEFINGRWVPYTRKTVVMEANKGSSFTDALHNEMNKAVGKGVKVTRISEDSAPYRQEYNPSHPDADVNGFVMLPNVDVLKEMIDMISASRAYEANVTVLNASKSLITKALEIGK